MRSFVFAVALCLSAALPLGAQQGAAPVVYKLSFVPEHHLAKVDVTFTNAPAGTLQIRMSRSSAGRYAVHEFAKNVYDVHAFDGKGKALAFTRPNPYQWNVTGHDGTVRMTYALYGDLVDGTYLAVDASHAHINMPATMMWARGFDDRPVRITLTPPAGSGWKPATQLYPTSDMWTFTAPNLQYMMDSPTELSNYALRQFSITTPDGKRTSFRAAVHSNGSDADVDYYAQGVEKIVREAEAVYGEFPDYEPGYYTFIADYLPYDGGDGMEHRNSTIVTGAGGVRGALSTASHEFFHCWNVERIRPKGLEPFNFEEANMTDSLWVAEGFTQYYGQLLLGRAGYSDEKRTVAGLGRLADAVINGPGRQFRSPVEMSHMAPFVDAARSIDPTNFSTTFISYYTYGGAVALGLDLSLRDKTNGKVTLDDFMRSMWQTFGKPGGPAPGLVGRPYALTDLRDRLAEVSGARAFADNFYTHYMIGRDVVDYARLFSRAGVVLRKRNAGRPWTGLPFSRDGSSRVGDLVAPGTPAYDAGLDADDVITAVEGTPATTFAQVQDAIAAHKPGDTVTVEFKRRTGATVTAKMTLKEDPSLEAVMIEDTGGTPTAEQKAFREAWLGPHSKQ